MGTATEDKAQRRSEHFPINAAGGENKTSHSNTGKTSESTVRRHAELFSRCTDQPHTLRPLEDANYNICCLAGLKTDFKEY